MSSEVLLSETRGRTRILTLNRPQAGNSVNAELSGALDQAVEDAASDADLRALILTGAGEKFFCTGGDIKEYRAITDRDQLNAIFNRTRQALKGLETLPIPVIVAVNGYALGGGMELVLASDIRLAAEDAALGLPQVQLGIIPGWHGIERLVREFGRGTAMKLAAGGQRISAADAAHAGLIDAVVPEDDLMDQALAVAASFDAASPLALAAVKSVVAASDPDMATANALSETEFAELWFSEDHREAEAAFAEKRSPAFKGK